MAGKTSLGSRFLRLSACRERLQEVPQRGGMRDPVVPEDCPQEVADVIAACTQRNAEARPSAKEVCRWVLHSCGDGTQSLKPVDMPC